MKSFDLFKIPDRIESFGWTYYTRYHLDSVFLIPTGVRDGLRGQELDYYSIEIFQHKNRTFYMLLKDKLYKRFASSDSAFSWFIQNEQSLRQVISDRFNVEQIHQI